MNLKIYQVDAFTENIFSGNPAAICPLENWISDEMMQKIALENNLSETAYFVKEGNKYHIRWFTPEAEIDLCGHATLASAFIIFNYLDNKIDQVIFKYKLGELIVRKNGDLLEMDFPSRPPKEVDIPQGLDKALGAKCTNFYHQNFGVALFENEETIKNLNPDFSALKKINYHGIIATAPGKNVDFISRVFAPNVGIDEDPVTGSAHTELIPFWAEKLGKNDLIARQISKRGGDLICSLNNDRVKIAGKAALYMIGEIYI